MKALLVAIFMVMTGVGIACAGEEHDTIDIKIVRAGDAGDSTMHWSGDPADLEGLEVGESKQLDDGITVTRTDDGLTFEIDGETVVVPNAPHHAKTMALMHKGDHDGDIDVEVIASAPHVAIRAEPLNNGIMIASGEAIDETTQETIRSVLASAGYDVEVRFIDRTGMHAKHVTVIEERIEKVDEE